MAKWGRIFYILKGLGNDPSRNNDVVEAHGRRDIGGSQQHEDGGCRTCYQDDLLVDASLNSRVGAQDC